MLSAHVITNKEQQKIRLLKIRNPWSEEEWRGDWSDQSYLWTLELKKELNFEAKDDGIFYIAIEDYVKFFYITTICKYKEGS